MIRRNGSEHRAEGQAAAEGAEVEQAEVRGELARRPDPMVPSAVSPIVGQRGGISADPWGEDAPEECVAQGGPLRADCMLGN